MLFKNNVTISISFFNVLNEIRFTKQKNQINGNANYVVRNNLLRDTME